MNDDSIFFLAAVIPLSIIVGGVVIIVMAMRQRGLTMEMKHRERMAMIERGVVPGPARDPAEFERWQERHEHQPAARATSIGVLIAALGIGLMLMIAFAGGSVGAGVGVGGSIAVIGVAFIINGELQRRTLPPPPRPRAYSSTPPLPGPPDHPGSVGS